MANSGLSQEFFIGGYDLSGDVGAIDECSSPREYLEAPVLNKSAMVRIRGRTDGKISFKTWFDDATGLEHDALKGLPTADVVVLWGLGNTLGDEAAGLVAKQVDYNWSRGADGSMEGSVQCLGQGASLEWVQRLTAGAVTHSSAGSETGVVDAGATTRGLIGYLQVMTISGAPTFLIQQSSNTTNGIDGAWTTIISFGASSARHGVRQTSSGAVAKGLRVTTTGTFSSAVFTMAYVRGTAQDDVTL